MKTLPSPLRVLITADPELPVPPRLYGGIERVIALLADGLVSRGHEVTLFAHRDSTVRCRLIPYATDRADRWSTIRNAASIAAAAVSWRPTVIHSFGRLAMLGPVLPLGVPKVMSYQRAVTPRSVTWGRRLSRGTLKFVACSARMIEDAPHRDAWRVIHNAVDIDTYAFSPVVAEDAPLVFLGRIEEIKGTHIAIDVARQTGRRLVIAGNVPDAHRAYFDQRVRPHLDGRTIDYVGPVDDAAKSELLSSAAALLMPILWEEPFGIVMAEALACGTPVIGLSRGSVPEVIQPGVTGAVCSNEEEMVQAVHGLSRLSRPECRRAAERRFSKTALVNAHEQLYFDLIGVGATASAAAPDRSQVARRGV